jgi:hypothetical protein
MVVPGSSETAHKRAWMALGPAVQGEVLTLAGQVQHCRTDANWRIGAVLRLARQCIPDTDRSSAALKLCRRTEGNMTFAGNWQH